MWRKFGEKIALLCELPHMCPSYGYYKIINISSLWVLNDSTWALVHLSNFPLSPKILHIVKWVLIRYLVFSWGLEPFLPLTTIFIAFIVFFFSMLLFPLILFRGGQCLCKFNLESLYFPLSFFKALGLYALPLLWLNVLFLTWWIGVNKLVWVSSR